MAGVLGLCEYVRSVGGFWWLCHRRCKLRTHPYIVVQFLCVII